MFTKITRQRICVRHILSLLLTLCLLGGSLPMAPPARAQDPEYPWWGSNMDYDPWLDVGDPTAAHNGAYHFTMPLLDLGGPMGLRFSLIYRSDFMQMSPSLPSDFLHRFWWSPKYSAVLAPAGWVGDVDVWTIQMANGNTVSFKKAGDEWVLPGPTDLGYVDNGSAVRYVLKETADYLYLMDPIAGRVHIFEKVVIGSPPNQFDMGRIVRVVDRNGNQLIYTYGANDQNNPIRIEDGLERSLDLTYGGSLTQVTDQAGRQVSFAFDNGADNGGAPTLRSVTDPLGQTTIFAYTTVQDPYNPFNIYFDNIVSVARPLGNVPYTQAYAAPVLDGMYTVRMVEQTDAYGNTTTLTYDPNQNQVTEDRPDGNEVIYQHHSNNSLPKSMTDAAGNTVHFAKNDDEQMTSITDRFGDTTAFTYHAETGKIASITSTEGDTLAYTYTPQDQTFTNPAAANARGATEQVTFTFYDLTQVNYPDGTHETFAYDDRGNMTTYTDQTGRTWEYQYNDLGLMTRTTNPTAGTTDYTYNPDGALASSTDSDVGTTSYEYDAYKRPSCVTHPDGAFTQIAYDLNDRVTTITDGRGGIYSYEYDANGNLVKATDPTGREAQYEYDLMDRMIGKTDRRGKTTEYTYDEMGRQAAITEPNGDTTELDYDPRGMVNRITNPANQSRQIGFDEEGTVTSMTTSMGNATTFSRDHLGQVTAIANPLGHTITFTRDERSRITAVTDALSRTTTYEYDDLGLLSSVSKPVIGAATFERNDLGLLTRITDPLSKRWDFGYTPMGRLQSTTDPLSNQWQYTYNQRGLLDTITHPEGGTQTWTYDGAGNPVRRQHSDDTDLWFTYDALDRLTAANGITFTYNEVGQVVNTQNPPVSFGATYDDTDRLQIVTYADGLFTVTYQYDTRDLLTRVTDSLTGAEVNFTYDDDGRLIGVQRSSGINATLTWDAASYLTRLQEGSLADLQYTYDAAGQLTSLNAILPLDPADYLTAETDTFTYDDASQVSAAGYAYDQRGRLTQAPGQTFTWDGVGWLTGTGSATMAYNGLRDLMTRSTEGNTTRYYYNHALAQRPIVAEKNEESGQWQRFYVLRPSGSLLYLIDAADGNKVYFYHFDKGGNTLFLTDTSGEVTDAYAYTPFGKLLTHEGANDQPFTFAGAWQARREGDSDLYQMRFRYYDAATARFISREPLWPKITNPKEINPYQYATANPMTYLDRTGLMVEDYEFDWGDLEDNWDGQEEQGLDSMRDWFDALGQQATDVASLWLNSLEQQWNSLVEFGLISEFDPSPYSDPGEAPLFLEEAYDPEIGDYSRLTPEERGLVDLYQGIYGPIGEAHDQVVENGAGWAAGMAAWWGFQQALQRFSPYGTTAYWATRISLLLFPEDGGEQFQVPNNCFYPGCNPYSGWGRPSPLR